MININENGKIYFQYLILIILIYFLCFLKLGNFHMRWWDESVFAVNSYEMLQNGKYFSLYFDNAPDYFNFKPPLTFWIQIIFIKILGYNELSLRLPSAIAASLSIIVIFRFVSRNFNYTWAWASALILMTSSGFITYHTARTADSDSLLTLFLLLANLFFIRFVLTNKRRDILFFFLFFILAFMTKSFAAFFFTPAYVIILFQKRLFKLFTFNWYFISGIVFFLCAFFGFFYLREIDTPGYIKALLYSDVSRIFNGLWGEHIHETLYYFNNMFETRFSIWFVFFVIGSVLIFFSANKIQKQILYFFLLLISVYLIIVTVSITKLIWYDMPLFPYLSVISAYPFYLLIQSLNVKEKPLKRSLTYLILVAFFFYPYWMMFNKSQGNTIPNGEKYLEANEFFINRKINKKEHLDGVKIYYYGWNGSLLFYKYKLAEKNEKIELVNDITQISLNDKIMVCNDSLKEVLLSKFDLSLLESCNNADLFITKPKIN